MRATWLLIVSCLLACGGSGDDEGQGAVTGGTGGAPTGGMGGTQTGGSGGAAGAAGMSTGGAGGGNVGGVGGVGGANTGGGGAGGMAGVPPDPPASCGDAARAYTVASTMLDASLMVAEADRFWGGGAPRTPVAVDPDSGEVFVGFTRAEGDARSVVIAAEGAAAADAIAIPDAVIGGVAVTSDGVAALVFDPNSDVDMRMWAAVARFTADGTEVFNTDLFRSPNLEDEGTKGAPSTARLGYVPGSDVLVPYFGHTQRYDDGVRHQGGYLATLSSTGEQDVLEGWFGSHNLDQRMMIDGDKVAVLGLGDAYPKGIFFSYIDNPRTNVIYRLAADGVGTTNGQLGGLVDMGDMIISPFITNRSVAQDLNAGTWPDIDEEISMQISDAAAAGTDMGLLPIPKSSLPDGDLEPVWLTVEISAGARLGRLKSARYGTAELIFLAWAEITGDARRPTYAYYTMVVDRDGAVCQPKTQLEAAHAFNDGDDIVAKPDGGLVWANVQGSQVQIVTLTP
jgi:hypothetical protein